LGGLIRRGHDRKRSVAGKGHVPKLHAGGAVDLAGRYSDAVEPRLQKEGVAIV
jgi:hypothetical protein